MSKDVLKNEISVDLDNWTELEMNIYDSVIFYEDYVLFLCRGKLLPYPISYFEKQSIPNHDNGYSMVYDHDDAYINIGYSPYPLTTSQIEPVFVFFQSKHLDIEEMRTIYKFHLEHDPMKY